MLKVTERGVEKVGKDHVWEFQENDYLFIEEMFSDFSQDYPRDDEGNISKRIDR